MYERVNWQNSPSTATPVSADNLNKMDKGIADIDSQLAEIETEPSFKMTTDSEEVGLSDNLVNGSGWTSAGWTGNFTEGFTHIVGEVQPLKVTLPAPTSAGIYEVRFNVTNGGNLPSARSDFYITIGGSEPFVTYQGTVTLYSFGIKSGGQNNELIITPDTDWNDTVSNISVKEITEYTKPALQLTDSNGNSALQIRTGKENLKNMYVGANSGKQNTSGYGNASLGFDALLENTSGYWNSAIGYRALKDNTVGSRNIAIGYQALLNNISGDRNVGIGTFALSRVTTGRCNVGIGADSLWYTTTGSHNFSVGLASMSSNVSGEHNISFGNSTLFYNIDGSNNIGMGNSALYRNSSGTDNIALGASANRSALAGNNNVSIGRASMRRSTEGDANVAIGFNSLTNKFKGEGNVVIGADSAGVDYGADTGAVMDRNVIIGKNSMSKLINGSRNVAIGSNIATNATSGTNNILIGYGVKTPTADASNYLNIGDVLTADLLTKILTVENGLVLKNLPTSDPGVKDRVWNDNGTLKISLGN